jgi:hypothetical protein
MVASAALADGFLLKPKQRVDDAAMLTLLTLLTLLTMVTVTMTLVAGLLLLIPLLEGLVRVAAVRSS